MLDPAFDILVIRASAQAAQRIHQDKQHDQGRHNHQQSDGNVAVGVHQICFTVNRPIGCCSDMAGVADAALQVNQAAGWYQVLLHSCSTARHHRRLSTASLNLKNDDVGVVVCGSDTAARCSCTDLYVCMMVKTHQALVLCLVWRGYMVCSWGSASETSLCKGLPI